MADIVKIKISQIKRKEMPSKFKEGETYNIVTVLDEISGRKGGAMGTWTDSWKLDDTIEGIWEEKSYKDKDGFDVKSWNIINPNKKEYRGGSGGGSWAPKKPSIVDAYTIAAALAPLLYGADKKLKLEQITKIADELMKKFSASAPAETKAEGKDVDLDKEEKPAKKKEVAEDFEVAPAKKAPVEDPDEDDDDDDIF